MERALDPPLTLTGTTVGHEEVSHASAGSHSGFAALYRTEYEAMIRLAFVMLGSQEQAEDVVHDALARLVERWTGSRTTGRTSAHQS